MAKEEPESEAAQSFSLWTRWLIAALMGCVLCAFAVSSLKNGAGGETKFSAARESVSEKRVATVMAALKSQYNTRDWNSSIPISRRDDPFSIDLSDAFVRDDSAPVLVRATLVDIIYGSQKIEVIFALPTAHSGRQNHLVLRCWSEQLDLFAEGVRGVSEYVVVANCYEVQNTLRGCNIIGGLIDAGSFSTNAKKQKIARNR